MHTSLLISAILLTSLLIVAGAAAEIPAGMAKATFAVHCYDVGANALSGKSGIISVERGWSGAREVDRVVYNPQAVTLWQLENWLKEADTYVSTLEAEINSTSATDMSQ
jgi:hypothetical protein